MRAKASSSSGLLSWWVNFWKFYTGFNQNLQITTCLYFTFLDPFTVHCHLEHSPATYPHLAAGKTGDLSF